MPCAFPDADLLSAVRAVLVPVDGPPVMVRVAGGSDVRFMRSLRALIGAESVERFRVTGRWEFWLDEDGRSAGKPVNHAATRVGRGLGARFDFPGSVVITGAGDDAEGWTGLSQEQVDVIFRQVTGVS